MKGSRRPNSGPKVKPAAEPKVNRTSDEAPSGLLCTSVAKDFGDGPVIEDLNLSIGLGENVVLAGHNGSGKSTLLRMAAGLADPSSGEVRIMGAKAGSLEARSVTAYIGDDPVLYDDLSVMEHLEYVARLHGASDWERRAAELVERFGLEARSGDLPSRLSRGLRQKTALVVGLIRPFAVLMIDEPFVGLDEKGRVALTEVLSEASLGGRTVIVATHHLDYLRQAKRCIGLRDGEIAYDGTPDIAAVQELLHG